MTARLRRTAKAGLRRSRRLRRMSTSGDAFTISLSRYLWADTATLTATSVRIRNIRNGKLESTTHQEPYVAIRQSTACMQLRFCLSRLRYIDFLLHTELENSRAETRGRRISPVCAAAPAVARRPSGEPSTAPSSYCRRPTEQSVTGHDAQSWCGSTHDRSSSMTVCPGQRTSVLRRCRPIHHRPERCARLRGDRHSLLYFDVVMPGCNFGVVSTLLRKMGSRTVISPPSAVIMAAIPVRMPGRVAHQDPLVPAFESLIVRPPLDALLFLQ